MTSPQNRFFLVLIVVITLFAAIVAGSNRVPILGDTRTRYGLDIQGGVRVTLRAKTEEYEAREKQKWNADKLDSVRKILENRVNATGVAEPVIIMKPAANQIIIELPGLKNKEEAIKQIQSTASLQFYLLPQLTTGEWRIQDTDNPVTKAKDEIIYDSKTNQPIPLQVLETAIFSGDPIVSGKDLKPNSRAVPGAGNGKPQIEFEFSEEGGRAFEEVTRANIGKNLAIFLDKKLLTAPRINDVIRGKGVIDGNFTLKTAKELSDQLNAGALPVGLEIVEQRNLEATLGQEAVATTTRAGLLGLGAVLIFMLVVYRLPGLIADVALLLYTLFSFAVFKGGLQILGIEPITLTLPGIAGFILSIGMAVDANILIFERIKEELRSGKTLRASIDSGFKRAFTAILDSNVCTMITCMVLYNFGTGPIRGFALTLGLGVLISMFTAITVTRTLLFSLVTIPGAQNAALYGVQGDHKPRAHNFMRNPRLWLIISTAIIIPGLVFWAAGGLKRGIEFQGGTELVLPFQERHSSDQIINALAQIKPEYKDSRVVVANEVSAKYAYVTMRKLSDEERVTVGEAVQKSVGSFSPGQKVSFSNVSGLISKELTQNAVSAVLVASLLIMAYLAFRFATAGDYREGLKYGVCAVVALLHDVLVVFGSFAILGKLFDWQIDSLFVTAMLTVVGFSVHDTIVVFDRIRENLQRRQRGESFTALADKSIDQTLTRSIYTSLTVVFTLLMLFLFGGSAVHQFTGALLIGIISGTYSSIFNATVLLVLFKKGDTGDRVAGDGPRSGLKARDTSGERPLVTPRINPTPAPAGATSNGTISSIPDMNEDGTPRTPRKQPQRRRRM